jgi:aminoglycoside 6'-N-acetyltransferase I
MTVDGQRWELRPAGLEDLPDVLRLALAFYAEDGFATTATELEANLRALFGAGPTAHIVLATRAGRSVGFALTTHQLVLESGLVAELQDLYVEPACRGCGVGAALVADSAEWARAAGAALLDVVVAPNGRDITSLLDYYAARGFQDEGRRLITLPL